MNNSDTVTTTGDTVLDTYAGSGNTHTSAHRHTHKHVHTHNFSKNISHNKHHHPFRLGGTPAESSNPVKYCLSLDYVIKGWQSEGERERETFWHLAFFFFFFFRLTHDPCAPSHCSTGTHTHTHTHTHIDTQKPLSKHTVRGLDAAGCLSVLSSDISMTTNRHCVWLWGPL